MPSSKAEGLAYKSRVMARPVKHGDSPNAVLASARRMSNLPNATIRSAMKADAWQPTAWNYLDTIGEYRYSVTWVGNTMSKARLTILKNGEPTTDPVAVEALDERPDTRAFADHLVGEHAEAVDRGLVEVSADQKHCESEKA